MKLLQEFKDFALKGNMIDMAIGIIIGAAFSKVVNVIVKDIFLPPLTYLTDGVNFQDKKHVLRDALIGSDGKLIKDEIAIGYGKLIEAGIDFLVIGATIFFVVKFMNRLKTKSENVEDVTVQTPKDIELLNKVANLLEKQNEILVTKQNG